MKQSAISTVGLISIHEVADWALHSLRQLILLRQFTNRRAERPDTQKGRDMPNDLSLLDLIQLFSSDEEAEQWFIKTRWPDGMRCPRCEGKRVGKRGNHPNLPYHCLDCKRFFSAKTGTFMHSSKIGYQRWAIAIFLMMSSKQGISSMRLHEHLGISQPAAWHMAHRIREAMDNNETPEIFEGPVEADETWIGGRSRSQTFERKKRLKMKPIIGMVDRATNRIATQIIGGTNSGALKSFVYKHTKPNTTVHTDEARGYLGLRRPHLTVNHSEGSYGPTNRIESLWSLIKRGQMGVYYKISPKHRGRYAVEFQERHNRRPMSMIDQMKSVVRDGIGKRLKLKDLTGGDPPYPPKKK